MSDDADTTGFPSQKYVPVCSIGASAGGVTALQGLFRQLPSNLGLAYVVILHLSPEHPSALSDILAGCTRMPVLEIEDGPILKPNCVYVIPPDRELVIQGDSVTARPFSEPRGRRAPIDMFFRSVAAARGDGVAIVLSGAGADGTLGVQAVKEAGGVILVQEPAEAAFPSMPQSAIASGAADFVAPLARLAERLAEVAHSKEAVRSLDMDGSANDLRRIVAFLRARTGHDFSSYKRATVMRRVLRRMQVCRRDTVAAYADYLSTTPEEAKELFSDLLISVTMFFRDPRAFEALERHAVKPIFDDLDPEKDESIRAWVVGCATGEEAYSIAMLLHEEAARRKIHPQFQIFASDLDEGALATAREGRYPRSIEADVSEERLARFFIDEGTHYRVRKELRESVLFATHSVLKEPPFMRLDLITCRNLLIYMERALQQQVCSIFRYGLKPGRFLFLGSAETTDSSTDLFATLDRDARIYGARPHASHRLPILPQFAAPERLAGPDQLGLGRPERSEVPISLHASALERAAPASALVDGAHNIVHLSPSAGRFILHSAGPVSNQLPAIVRPELRLDLRLALTRALDGKKSTLTHPAILVMDGERRRISMHVAPVPNGEHMGAQALVFFLDDDNVPEDEEPDTPSDAHSDEVRRLHAELKAAQEAVVASRAGHEISIQDLRATNEELQSINEEYRSTAEELETSKEELQSINEELHTVNAELKSKLASISVAHSDLQNLTDATEVGTLFLDSDLRIKMFTPPIADLFNITKGDYGRTVTDFSHRLDYDGIDADARQVLRQLAPIEREVRSRDGRSFVMRMRPYRTIEDRIDGVVLTFFDITDRLRAEAALRESEARFAQFANASAAALWIRDADTLAMEFTSRAIETIYGIEPNAILGEERKWAALIVPDDRDVALDHIQQARRGDAVVHEFRIQRPSDGAFRWIRNTDFPLYDADGRVQRIGGIAEDVTEAKLATEHQAVLLAELQHRVRNVLALIRSITTRTGESAGSVTEYTELMMGRLMAFARVQTLLTRAANASVGIASIVRDEVSVQAQHEGQYVLDGLDIQLSPKAAEVLTLAIHELATNAVKYGALSVPSGKVSVRWSTFEKRGGTWLSFDWLEEGTPVRQEPSSDVQRRRGFGSELIEGRVPYELKGQAKIAIETGGARCHLEFPLESRASILETDAPQQVTVFGGALDMTGEPDLSGHRILVVEDDYFLASDAARALQGAGAEVMGPCPNEEHAHIKLDDQQPTAAVLDINLGSGATFKLAERLKDSRIPFVFVTGYDQAVIPAEFNDIERLQKPVQLREIVGAVSRLAYPGV